MTKTYKTIDKPIVVAVGLFIPGNSFTRVFESLFEQLSLFYTIHWLGIAYKQEKEERKYYTLHPCNVKGGDMFGAYESAILARELKAKCILLLNDFYLLKNYELAWKPLKNEGIKLLAYVPLDGEIIDESIVRDCLFLDKLILYNQWAKDQVEKAIEKFSGKQKVVAEKIPELGFCYHGVDRNVFRPATSVTEKKRAKEKVFSIPDAGNALFILNANRYNERKDIETTIQAFANAVPLFNRHTCLVLHTPNIKPHLKEQLQKLLNDSGVPDRILLNPLGEEYADDTELVKLYQACDIGMNTSLGEGWGMISFEHAACGAAQLIPGHTGQHELWENAGIIVKADIPVKLDTNPFQMYKTSPVCLAEELVKLVNDDIYRSSVVGKCASHTSEKKFSWAYIADRWKEYIN